MKVSQESFGHCAIGNDSKSNAVENRPVGVDLRDFLVRSRRSQSVISRELGPIYANIGDIMWQFMCEIALAQNEDGSVTFATLAEQFDLPISRIERLVGILVGEQLIAVTPTNPQAIALTRAGERKINSIFLALA